MHLALDFDNTFTVDPAFWTEFINEAKVNSHKVWIVTARHRDRDGINWAKVQLKHEPCPVIWCDGKPKRHVVKEQGIEINVWIDDDPYSLLHGSQFTPEALAAWRDQDAYANRRQSPQGTANRNGSRGLLSRRAGSGSRSLSKGK